MFFALMRKLIVKFCLSVFVLRNTVDLNPNILNFETVKAFVLFTCKKQLAYDLP